MPAAEPLGRIGPRAITHLEAALRERLGEGPRLEVFARAGLLRHLAVPPTQMVPESDVTRLHAALHAALPPQDAAGCAEQAGRDTARYLLEQQIPLSAQKLLRQLPRGPAAWLFTQAIARHAWTFGGTARFSAMRDAGGIILVITDNPAVRSVAAKAPCCHYFAAAFEDLYRAILGPSARVAETGCEGAGARMCSFRVSWGAR